MVDQIPKILFHGNPRSQDVLRPAFPQGGEEGKGDENASNRFLYATSDEDYAIELGLAVALEKDHLIDRFVINENAIEITLNRKSKRLSQLVVRGQVIYLYQITTSSSDEWVPVFKRGQELNEFKTRKRITTFKKRVIRINTWLGNRQVKILYPR